MGKNFIFELLEIDEKDEIDENFRNFRKRWLVPNLKIGQYKAIMFRIKFVKFQLF